MLPEIYLIRHGQTITNKAEIACGISETDLTDLGVKQAAQAGEFLCKIPFKKALVSSLRRTRQTFDGVCLSPDIAVEYDQRLWEINLGEYELKTEAQFAKDVSLPGMLEDHDMRVPGGESLNDMKVRLREILAEKVAGEEGPVLIVSHGMTTRVLLMLLGDNGDELYKNVVIGNCEVWKVKAGECQKVFDPQD